MLRGGAELRDACPAFGMRKHRVLAAAIVAPMLGAPHVSLCLHRQRAGMRSTCVSVYVAGSSLLCTCALIHAKPYMCAQTCKAVRALEMCPLLPFCLFCQSVLWYTAALMRA